MSGRAPGQAFSLSSFSESDGGRSPSMASEGGPRQVSPAVSRSARADAEPWGRPVPHRAFGEDFRAPA